MIQHIDRYTVNEDHKVWLSSLYAAYNAQTMHITPEIELNFEEPVFRNIGFTQTPFSVTWKTIHPPLLERQKAFVTRNF